MNSIPPVKRFKTGLDMAKGRDRSALTVVSRDKKSEQEKTAARYYFEVNPGGYGNIPDKEYLEFDREEDVIFYAQNKFKGESVHTLEVARKFLLQAGQFGEFNSPETPDLPTGEEEEAAPVENEEKAPAEKPAPQSPSEEAPPEEATAEEEALPAEEPEATPEDLQEVEEAQPETPSVSLVDKLKQRIEDWKVEHSQLAEDAEAADLVPETSSPADQFRQDIENKVRQMAGSKNLKLAWTALTASMLDKSADVEGLKPVHLQKLREMKQEETNLLAQLQEKYGLGVTNLYGNLTPGQLEPSNFSKGLKGPAKQELDMLIQRANSLTERHLPVVQKIFPRIPVKGDLPIRAVSKVLKGFGQEL